MLPGGRYFNLPPIRLLEQCHKDYGHIWKIEIPWQRPTVFLVRPEDNREIFMADDVIPRREDFVAYAEYRKSRGMGAGIAAAEGEQWKEYRELGQKVLGGPLAAMEHISKITESADMFIEHLKLIRDDPNASEVTSDKPLPPNTVTNFQEPAKLWAFETMNMMALGAPVGIYQRDEEAARLFNATMDLFYCFTVMNQSIPMWKLFSTKVHRQMTRSTDIFWEICGGYVTRALAAPVPGSKVAMLADQTHSERQRMLVTDIMGDLLFWPMV